MNPQERDALHEYARSHGWEPVQGLSRQLNGSWLLLARRDGTSWMFHVIRMSIPWGQNHDPRLAKRLSRGWQVIASRRRFGTPQPPPAMTCPVQGDPDPKDTDEVTPSNEQDGDLHGGSHASREVQDSHEAACQEQTQEGAAGTPAQSGCPQPAGGSGGSPSPDPHESSEPQDGSGDLPASSEGAGKEQDEQASENAPDGVQGASASSLLPEAEQETLRAETPLWAGDWQLLWEEEPEPQLGQFQLASQRNGPRPAWAPTRARPLDADERRAAMETARELASLVGQVIQRDRLGLDAVELAYRVQMGLDPSPALTRPRRARRAAVLITPDVSGSCQNWSPVWQGVAKFLVERLGNEVELFYIENVNGVLIDQHGAPLPPKLVAQLLERTSVMFYAGDTDGLELTEEYARRGAVVIAYDNYRAARAEPYILREYTGMYGSGQRVWVASVSVREPSTWVRAARMAVAHAL